VTDTTSAAIRWVAFVVSGKGLQPTPKAAAGSSDISRREVFHNLDLARVLADAPKRDSGSAVEVAVCNVDIGRVLLQGDGIVSAFISPSQVGDIVGVDGVRSWYRVNMGGGQLVLEYIPSVFKLQPPKVPAPGSQELLT